MLNRELNISGISLLFIATLILACIGEESSKVSPAFYHWKTKINVTEQEQKYLADLNANTIYLRLFDVDWDFTQNMPIPLAEAQFQKLPKEVEFIPAVFITNRTLLHIQDSTIALLATEILQKISVLSDTLPGTPIPEIQIDCDWTQKTRSKYFQLLALIEKKLHPKGIQLSATIRLHQVKYADKTGVPPVDRGMLMFYNMGDVEDPNAKNSILDIEIAKAYMSGFEAYPLPLDVALPLFSWGVLIRDGKMIKLINLLEESHLEDSSRFNQIKEDHYQVIQSTYLQGYYLYKGDVIRLEVVRKEVLKEAIDLLSKHLSPTDRTLAFYHLDTTLINRFRHEVLSQLCSELE